MKQRLSLALTIVAAVVALVFVAGPASSESCRANVPSVERDSVLTVSGNSLVSVDPGLAVSSRKMTDSCGERVPLPRDGMVRHPVSRAAVGFAYVIDHDGSDDVVLGTNEGLQRVSAAGEVVHPDISARGEVAWVEDFEELKVLSTDQRRVETVPMPGRATALFSPTFVSSQRIVAVAQEPAKGVPAEDDGLNNLWSHSEDRGWTRVTDFEGDERHWSVIRTPVTAPDGTLYFVRVTADAHATRPPTFSLWKVVEGSATEVGDLPTEMYLAGATDEGLLWNIQDASCSDWGLFAQSADGLAQIGCGAVTADPVATVDPDVDAHGDASELDATAAEESRVGVAVGDFRTRREARAVARRIRASFPARIADHAAARDAVRPGAWAVLIPSAGDGTAQLRDVRTRFPELRPSTWVVPLP